MLINKGNRLKRISENETMSARLKNKGGAVLLVLKEYIVLHISMDLHIFSVSPLLSGPTNFYPLELCTFYIFFFFTGFKCFFLVFSNFLILINFMVYLFFWLAGLVNVTYFIHSTCFTRFSDFTDFTSFRV